MKHKYLSQGYTALDWNPSPLATESTVLTTPSLLGKNVWNSGRGDQLFAMLQDCAHINKDLPGAQEVPTANTHRNTSYAAFSSGRFHRAQTDGERKMLKGILETLLLIGSPTLFDLTESVKSDVCISHISSPSIFYCGVRFCEWVWEEKEGRGRI